MSFDLRSARLNRGLTLRAAAAAADVDMHALWRAEKGGTPNPATAKLIADFYDVTVTDLWPVAETERVA